VFVRFLIHVVALLFVFYVVWGIRGGTLWAAVVILTLGLFVSVLTALLFGLSFAVLNGIMNLHIALSFGQILIGYLIYAIASFVLTRLL
jgi:uncharacterized membrane protein YvlD (DUF360 family)